MNAFKEDFIEICRSERGIVALIVVNFLLALALIVFSFICINPNSASLVVSYSDLSGYNNGSWENFLVFPILGLVLGIFHNVIALRLYRKRGSGMTKFFLVATTLVILGTIFVLARLTEGNP